MLFHDFRFILAKEVFDYVEVQIALLVRVKAAEYGNCVEIRHLFKLTFFGLKLQMIVNFFLDQATQFKLDVRL